MKKTSSIIMIGAPALMLGLALCIVPRTLQAQSDDFNNGDDLGWTRFSPLGPFGVPGVFSFPNGDAYRIQTFQSSPAPDLLGPPRAYSLREDVNYVDFYVTVDLVDWNDTYVQAFGILARISNPGLGTANGYAFTYEHYGRLGRTDAQISRIDSELPVPVPNASGGIYLDPTKDYRLVFMGKGPLLEGRIYELPNICAPVLAVSGYDATYASGVNGVVVYDNSDGTGKTDATFDNYFAAVIETPQDAIAPTITCPANITVPAASPAGVIVSFNPAASDNCDPQPTVRCSPASGSVFPIGVTTVNCTASDASGNTATCNFAVTVEGDTTPPTITCPANITVPAPSPAGATVSFSVTASDNRDPNPVVNCSPAPGSTFPIGGTTVNCTATDVFGNSATCSFTITVKGAAEQIADLIALVQNLALNPPTANSLLVKLEGASTLLSRGNVPGACGKLKDFVAEVKAQLGKMKITQGQADLLILEATRIRAVLGCVPVGL